MQLKNNQDKLIIEKVKNKWENELQCDISSMDWEQMCKNI